MTHPTKVLKQKGTLDKRRQGDRMDEVYPEGKPTQPRGLHAEGKRLWKLILDNMPAGVISPVDGPSLYIVCRFWEHFREHEKKGNVAEMQRSYRCFSDASKKFGMAPIDRTHIKGKPEKQKTAFDQIMELNASDDESIESLPITG